MWVAMRAGEIRIAAGAGALVKNDLRRNLS
jgi:hypothetical protein